MKQPVGPCLLVTPVELPGGNGHPQDRPGDRGRLHDGRQTRRADSLTMLALAQLLSRGRAAGRGTQRRDLVRCRRGGEAAAGGPPAAQALLHRLDAGRSAADASSRRGRLLRLSMELGGNAPFLVFADADLDLAVEQADGREDAQHGPVVRRRQPVPRRGLGRRGVHREADREDGRPDRRPRHRCRSQRRAARSMASNATRSRSWSMTRPGAALTCASVEVRRRRGLLLRADRARRRPRRFPPAS